MKAVEEAIQLLENITGARVVLKEDVFSDFLAKGKQPKAVRDTIEKLQSWQNVERIPEREWNKFQTISYKLSPTQQTIYPIVSQGDFPLYDKQMDEYARLIKKYAKPGEDSIFDIHDRMSKDEQVNWQKIMDTARYEQLEFRNAQSEQKRGQEIKGVLVPYSIWKQLKSKGFLPEIRSYSLDVRNAKKLTSTIESFTQGLKMVAKYPDAIKLYQRNIAEIQKYIPIALAVEQFQSKIESGKDQKMREKKQEIKGSVNPIIYQQVEIIAEDFRKVIEKNQYGLFMRDKADFLKASKEAKTNDLYVIFPEDLVPTGRYKGFRDKNDNVREKWNEILNYLKSNDYSSNKSRKVELKSDEELQKKAFDMSTEEAKRFLIKMADKLGGIFKDINVTLEIKKISSRSMRRNELEFIINGGESSFLIQNQITQNYSHLGTFFYRYPTTFHNAIVKGNKVKMPDEVSVKQALVQAYG